MLYSVPNTHSVEILGLIDYKRASVDSLDAEEKGGEEDAAEKEPWNVITSVFDFGGHTRGAGDASNQEGKVELYTIRNRLNVGGCVDIGGKVCLH